MSPENNQTDRRYGNSIIAPYLASIPKPIIIFGDKPQSRTGKSFLAKQMSLLFKNPIAISARENNPSLVSFFFQNIKKDTDLIIIDEVGKPQFESVVDRLVFPCELRINSRGLDPFVIKRPQVMIIIDEDEAFLRSKGASFLCRCEFIKTSIVPSPNLLHNIFEAEKVNLNPCAQ